MALCAWIGHAARLSGPTLVATSLIVIGIIDGWTRLRLYSLANFAAAPIVSREEDAEHRGDVLLFLHASDVHITTPRGAVPVGGGRDGTAELCHLVDDICHGALSPRFLLLTGDLIDRGNAKEWTAGRRELDRLGKRTRVLLAPGNHDLVPSYVTLDAIWATRRGGSFLDGIRLFDYLSQAAELEPDLRDCHNDSLADIVAREQKNRTELLEAWTTAYMEARQLFLRHPAASFERAEAFGQSAHTLYPHVPATDWTQMVGRIPPGNVDMAVISPMWSRFWYDCFPLRLSAEEDGVEFFVTNSTDTEVRLAGSAIGRCGSQQLTRLRTMVRESTAAIAIVLHHHAPFRWADDSLQKSGGLLRWGTLAHEAAESKEIAALLSDAATNKQVLVLSGHRHDPSRCGRVRGEGASALRDLWFLESGALGEPGAAHIPAGWLADGRVRTGLVPRCASAVHMTS